MSNKCEDDEDFSDDECEWCGRNIEECGPLYPYSNKYYKGNYCDACCELSHLAEEAIDKDNS